MSETINHSTFSGADIERYWRGQLTPAQMHALEQAALEDPFLADAMDGYRERSHQQAVEKDVAELQQRLATRVGEKKQRVIAFANWWKIAAVLVVLAGAVWMYRFITTNTTATADKLAKKDTGPAAPAPKTSTPATDAVQPPPAAYYHTTDSTVAGNGNQPESKSSLAANSINRQTQEYKHPLPPYNFKSRQDTGFIAIAPPKASAKSSAEVAQSLQGRLPGMTVAVGSERKKTLLKKDTLDDQILAKSTVPPRVINAELPDVDKEMVDRDYKKSEKISIRGTGNSNLNSFSGQVVDNLHHPVAGASVMIHGQKDGVATDSLGYFTIKTPDTAAKVSVASVGFQQRNAMLRNNASSYGPSLSSNQIVLQQNNSSLQEVVVTGYGSTKKRNVTGNVSVYVSDAEPVISWEKYNDYLANNKKVPAALASVHGVVVVRFYVSRNGKKKDFSIEKSLHKTLDDEAIRLVKSGPAWHLLRGKKAMASVMVNF